MSFGVETGHYSLHYFKRINQIFNPKKVNASIDYSRSYIWWWSN